MRATLLMLCLWIRHTEAICPSSCVCDDATLVVTCHNIDLDVIPITLNPAIKQLSITQGKIKIIIPVLGFYTKLEFLNLSHNQISAINPNTFEAVPKLRVLGISHNIISELWENMFRGLGELRVLELNDNILETLPDKVFMHLKKMDFLDLSSNRISFVQPEAFFGLKALRKLHLQHNSLTHVPTESLAPLSGLLHLNLSVNKFESLVAASFEPLTSLEQLDLDGCGLVDIPENAFRGLENLRVLRINNNLLGYPPTWALQSLSRLEELSIGQNPFNELGANVFRGLQKLRVLEVDSAPLLLTVRRLAFASNPALDIVNLINNPKFSILEAGVFDGVSNLRHLSLRGNAFISFGEKLLAWNELDSVDLSDNPLECNCSLLWLRNFLQARNLSRGYNGVPVATCENPFRIQGHNVGELSEEDLCYHYPKTVQHATVVLSVIAAIATLILIFIYR